MRSLTFLFLLSIFSGCIGDDIIDDSVPESIRYTACVDTLGLGMSFQLEAQFFDNLGIEMEAPIIWESSDSDVIEVDDAGLITGLSKGSSTIFAVHADFTSAVSAEKSIVVADNTIISGTGKTGTIVTTSSYQLEGTFSATQEGDDLLLSFNEDFKASTALPGLYLYLTNNPSTNSGALEVKAVDIFSGSHEITVPNTDINTYQYLLYYCKPFSVKVGEGAFE